MSSPRLLKDNPLLKTDLFINGAFRSSKKTYTVNNPSTNTPLIDIAFAQKAEVDDAIVGADKAFQSWRKTTAKQRQAILHNWADLMETHKQDLAEIMSYEQGRPVQEALGEVEYAKSFCYWFGDEALRSYGQTIPGLHNDQHIIVVRQPVGVVGAITPWNFPLAMITRKVAPALAAGCTFVLKPSKSTPLSANALAFLAQKAGFPKGVFNVITGESNTIGDAFMNSDIVRKFSFTGSTAVGSLLMSKCAKTIKKLSLELGGNAPFIVFEDADIDKAVEGGLVAKFRNNGQTCVCVNRFYIHTSVYQEFIQKFTEKVKSLKVGDVFSPQTQQGPLINTQAVEKVQSHVDDALAKGATCILGGKPHKLGGNFYEPTVLIDANATMALAQEETFGPVAAIFPFTTEDDVIALANDTPFGLAGYFYSQDMARVWRISEALEVGMVGVNTGLISNAAAPFGGVKQSGLGREGSHQGLVEYEEYKYILMTS